MGKLGQRLNTWELLIQDQLEQQGLSGWEVLAFQSVQSTMDAAQSLVAEKQPLRGLVLSATQFAGRGRLGNSWLSPQQGLFCTYIFRSSVEVKNLVGFSLVLGLAVCELCERLGCKLGLKWPNDLLDQSSGKKLCGVLIELSNHSSHNFLLAGVGINIAGAPDALNATSISELCDRRPSPYQLAADLAEFLDRDFRVFEQKGFSAFKHAWLAKALHIGAECEIEQAGRTVSGMCVGIGDDGQLLLERNGVRVSIVSGHPIFKPLQGAT